MVAEAGLAGSGLVGSGVLGDSGVLGELNAEHSARWRGLDGLLPPARALPVNEDGVLYTVAGEGGRLAGAGVARVQRLDAGSMDATWSALETYQLVARVGGADPAGALDGLLAQWRAGLPEVGGADTAAMVNWPSRDTAAALPLVRHGLAPLIGITARPAGRAGSAIEPPAGVRIRPAERRDLDAQVELRLATLRYDAQFGVLQERPATAGLMREHCERVFEREGEWSWVATRDGEVIGMITVEPPEYVSWIAGMVDAPSVAYVDVLGMRPDSRGTGAGGALLAHAHRALDAAGVAVTLLHHALPNPLSTPFYGRHGYRPLYTVWETRPAGALR